MRPRGLHPLSSRSGLRECGDSKLKQEAVTAYELIYLIATVVGLALLQIVD